jgi:hypothetical protein
MMGWTEAQEVALLSKCKALSSKPTTASPCPPQFDFELYIEFRKMFYLVMTQLS